MFSVNIIQKGQFMESEGVWRVRVRVRRAHCWMEGVYIPLPGWRRRQWRCLPRCRTHGLPRSASNRKPPQCDETGIWWSTHPQVGNIRTSIGAVILFVPEMLWLAGCWPWLEATGLLGYHSDSIQMCPSPLDLFASEIHLELLQTQSLFGKK